MIADLSIEQKTYTSYLQQVNSIPYYFTSSVWGGSSTGLVDFLNIPLKMPPFSWNTQRDRLHRTPPWSYQRDQISLSLTSLNQLTLMLLLSERLLLLVKSSLWTERLSWNRKCVFQYKKRFVHNWASTYATHVCRCLFSSSFGGVSFGFHWTTPPPPLLQNNRGDTWI